MKKLNETKKYVGGVKFYVLAIDLQLGRSGNDFEEGYIRGGIQKSKLGFRWEMLQRIEATIEGIGAALEKGVTQRSRSEEEIKKKDKELCGSLQTLNAMRDRLTEIKNCADGTG